MVIPDIIGKNVLIIGCPASGKTFLSNSFKTTDTHKVIHTDDFMSYGYKESLYVILQKIKPIHLHTNTVIEGIQGYRLLRKGVELNCYFPDLVIELVISESRMFKTYRSERQGKSVDSLHSFNKMHDKILSDYRAMPNKHKPQWISIYNDY